MRAGLTVVVVLAATAVGCGGQPAHSPSTASTTANSTSATASAPRGGTSRVTLTVPAANGGFGRSREVTVPRGWRAEVWALVPGARLEAWTPEGRLLVSSPDDGSISELAPGPSTDTATTRRTLVSGLTNPQGMAFARVDGQEYLFVAESNAIDRFEWRDGAVGARTVIVGNLPDGGSHPLKNVVVAADGTVYFDIGSASNADPPSGTTPPRATVMAMGAGGAGLHEFASGVRNGDGLSFAPDGSLWTAVNERDDVPYPFHQAYGGRTDAYGQVIPSYVNDHPPDEVARLTAGRDLGWPYCDPDSDVHPGHAGTAFDYGAMRFDSDAETNSGGHAKQCSALPRIERGLPAHSAPLGLHFLEHSRLPARWSAGAVVAVHGSWDRNPPRAPAVLWMPWESRDRTLGAPVTLLGGFQDSSGNRWGRPVDAVPGPDGALYVSDDQAGAIYRLVPAR